MDELDDSTCTYRMTPASSTHPVVFDAASGNLIMAYNLLVGELNHSIPIEVGIAADVAIILTHFNTSDDLTNVMGEPEVTALAACVAITIVSCVEGVCSV